MTLLRRSAAVVALLTAAFAVRADEPTTRRSIFDFSRPATRPASATTRPASAAGADAPRTIFTTQIHVVADDFVADVHHNGKPLPDSRRKLLAEIHGAQVERVTVNLRAGDWIVFHVVNNRLRWNGAYYFAAAALNPDGVVIFPTETQSGDWSACDDLEQAARFIADRDHGRDQKPQPVRKPWEKGLGEMLKACPDFTGQPIWGEPRSKSTWIKFIVPAETPTPAGAGRGL